MKLSEFKTQLAAHPEAQLIIALPTGGSVPRHFHVTEVGHVAKRFVDCGGTFRASESCLLQTWIATKSDDGHRLTAGKFAKILGLAESLFPCQELPVEVEYEEGVIAQFPVETITVADSQLTIHVGFKHTDCLAKEKCGMEDGATPVVEATGCCSKTSGCC